ncbi:MAG TPA: 23S rRNA (guanosine(2251)-2'-O)-methyltransferase RlmB [Acidobacteriota bacterium]|nr:23S rRNA (guanosine(2251)-2'-O)-methyltransferase RlmB [Acidobacteriota bacterium]
MQLIYGIHAVSELLKSAPHKIERLWVAQDSENTRLRSLVADAKRHGISIHFEPREAIRRRAASDRHQGVVAAIASIQLLDEDAILNRCGESPLLLILDGITDPQNLGAILRTAEAAAVDGVFLPERRTAPVSPAVVKASAGGAHHLLIGHIGNVSYFIEKLQQGDFRVIGLDAAAETNWCDADLTGPLALVLGSEGEGLRPLVKKTCDQLIRVPMLGRIEALNVSAAAAAVLFEAVRQRMKR